MPNVRVARLRCVHRFSATVGSSMGRIHISANDVVFPIGTHVAFSMVYDTHQPMGFDQWAALYNHYVVIGSKTNVTISGPVDAAHETQPSSFGLYLSDETDSPYTRATTYIEARKGQVRHMYRNQTRGTSMAGYYSPRRVFGVKDVVDVQDSIGAAVTMSPQKKAYHVLWWQLDNRVAPITDYDVYGYITTDYIVSFSDPKDIGRST